MPSDLEAPIGDGPAKAKRTFIEEARRKQIVGAAIEVLSEHGFSGTTFARIAERADISPALISYHFTSKAQLMAQVVASVTADLEVAITDEIGEAASYRAALRGLIESQVRYFAAHTQEVLALGEVFAHLRDETYRAEVSRAHSQDLDELETMFREGQDEGELRAFPTRPMAVTLMAALEAVPAQVLGGADPDEYGRALADIFDAAVRR